MVDLVFRQFYTSRQSKETEHLVDMSVPGRIDPLYVDLYELTMAQAYLQSGQTGHATFSLYFRNFPQNRTYYVFCGLESAISYLENLKFSESDLEVLEELGLFDGILLDYLSSFEFTGSVRAMREGEVFFPNEPVIEVSGPIIECQIAETFLINQVNLESMLATKAARVVAAAGGRQIVDFASRRTHGLDAGLKLARASYIAGFDGTSNVRAASDYAIPAVGTMAHSYISTFDSEFTAFSSYAESFPDSSIFLVDTYDTLGGVRSAIQVAQKMHARGSNLRAIRLDSGDMATLSQQAREMLDEAGLQNVRILASSGLDEYSVSDLVCSGAPIDGFGVGTRVGASADAPFTDFVYKLVEYDGMPMMKLSEDKMSLPGPKQVFRMYDGEGMFDHDVIAHANLTTDKQESRQLLYEVMENGRLKASLPDLNAIRQYHRGQVQRLPPALLGPTSDASYRVDISEELLVLSEQLKSHRR